MSNEAIIVLTARGLNRHLREGGSKAWKLNPQRARNTPYVICVQNRRPADSGDDWGNATHPHHEAFLVGKIKDVVSASVGESGKKKRWLIQFSEYAEVSVPNSWSGSRNPVAYTTLEDFGIDPLDLEFKPMPEPEVAPDNDLGPDEDEFPDGIGIKKAKELLARKYETSIDKIEIIIRA